MIVWLYNLWTSPNDTPCKNIYKFQTKSMTKCKKESIFLWVSLTISQTKSIEFLHQINFSLPTILAQPPPQGIFKICPFQNLHSLICRLAHAVNCRNIVIIVGGNAQYIINAPNDWIMSDHFTNTSFICLQCLPAIKRNCPNILHFEKRRKTQMKLVFFGKMKCVWKLKAAQQLHNSILSSRVFATCRWNFL